MLRRKRLKVKGIVQGVGFRPFVYRLANDLNLKGFVRNTTSGVDIEIEGKKHCIDRFVKHLKENKPEAARIDFVLAQDLPTNDDKKFIIKESKITQGFTQISPDIATCQDCLHELNNLRDRRYRFPFINCTNCGPRYSIVMQTPYDRKRTSMKDFKMCNDCANEFQKIADRRFHAQPDCCARCGPEFSLYSITSKKISTKDTILKTAELLRQGKIIAIKGIGGFHIACDATNDGVVRKLRRLKNRPTKPLAIMARLKDLKRIVDLNKQEEEMISAPSAPIMLLKKKGKTLSEAIAPGNPYLGVIAPYTPMHHLLLERIPFLVMTSANIQDEPIVKDDKEVITKLSRIVSFYLTHNRRIENRCDDSIGFYSPTKGFSILRRSRGYAPVPIELPVSVEPTLAVGPYLKNTFALANKAEAYISPHIGDLDNLETLRFFNEMIKKYQEWFRIEPKLIVHDLHPDYLSTKIGQKILGKKIGVQHHIAHVVSCLGENKVFDEAIGIAFDGTGYGLDGKIWGGEFFVGDLGAQKRVAHLEYLPLPGGEAAIKKPYRIAIAYLYKLLGQDASGQYTKVMARKRMFARSLRGANLSRLSRVYSRGAESRERRSSDLCSRTLAQRGTLDFLHLVPGEVDAIQGMIDHDRNLVYTSSMGRFFDCVAAMLGLMKEITYEAEAAINLEYIAAQGIKGIYPYQLKGLEPIVIEVEDILAAIMQDLKKGISKGIISAKFHNTVVDFSLDVTRKLSRLYGMKRVCLSGGVFQNRYLLNLMIDKFERAGFKVYVHHQLPTNDGCISYGQVIAGNLMGEK